MSQTDLPQEEIEQQWSGECVDLDVATKWQQQKVENRLTALFVWLCSWLVARPSTKAQPTRNVSDKSTESTKRTVSLHKSKPLSSGCIMDDSVSKEGHMALAMGAKCCWCPRAFCKSGTWWQKGTPPQPHTIICACTKSMVTSDGNEDFAVRFVQAPNHGRRCYSHPPLEQWLVSNCISSEKWRRK